MQNFCRLQENMNLVAESFVTDYRENFFWKPFPRMETALSLHGICYRMRHCPGRLCRSLSRLLSFKCRPIERNPVQCWALSPSWRRKQDARSRWWQNYTVAAGFSAFIQWDCVSTNILEWFSMPTIVCRCRHWLAQRETFQLKLSWWGLTSQSPR